MKSVIKRLGIAIALISMIFTPQVVLALAPASPFFFIDMDPEEGEVAAGSSITINVKIASQEGYEGNVILSIENPPDGITATFDPDPTLVPGFAIGLSTATIEVASSVSLGVVELTILGIDEAGDARDADATLTITVIAGSGSVPAGSVPAGSVPASGSVPSGEVVTVTVTSTSTTTLSTVTTTTTSLTTVTQVITTRTSAVATKTTVDDFDQVGDLIYPIGTLAIVIILIGVAVIMLRKPKT